MTNKETNMNTLDAIHQRRAIKYFDLTHQFEKEETQQLIESEMQFPSPFNIQYWQLVNVADKALIARNTAHDRFQVTKTSCYLLLQSVSKPGAKIPQGIRSIPLEKPKTSWYIDQS
jgi:nitroreductase